MDVKTMERDGFGQLPTYAWPGGYPIIYITRDGLTVCAKCASRDIDSAQEIIGADVYYEGPPVTCDDCEETVIESAYGDPSEEKENA